MRTTIRMLILLVSLSIKYALKIFRIDSHVHIKASKSLSNYSKVEIPLRNFLCNVLYFSRSEIPERGMDGPPPLQRRVGHNGDDCCKGDVVKEELKGRFRNFTVFVFSGL
ncbi:hypothetical protein TNIN_224761 [Trichonephila inaurata madagascariensis]|uniref:Secreted protein n=1 Tax=Trichonephila inaurata madagascariensis TaxID=2747483 RepID=A0A8X7CGR2_9ARAC|nr:hypothetical protein TNIN_224761 [Trichonephila inaurata madagascariensis]